MRSKSYIIIFSATFSIYFKKHTFFHYFLSLISLVAFLLYFFYFFLQFFYHVLQLFSPIILCTLLLCFFSVLLLYVLSLVSLTIFSIHQWSQWDGGPGPPFLKTFICFSLKKKKLDTIQSYIKYPPNSHCKRAASLVVVRST